MFKIDTVVKAFVHIIFLLLCQVHLYAQFDRPLLFNHLDSKGGLPSNTVNDILVDRYGFVWFATRAGLCRYDGLRVRNFPLNAEHLNNNAGTNILGLDEAAQGDIWVGTDRWLYKINAESGHFTHHSPDSTFLNHDATSRWIPILDHKGYIWSGSIQNRLSFFDTDGGKYHYIPGDWEKENFVEIRLVDSFGNCWFQAAKTGKLYRVNHADINLQDLSQTEVSEYPVENLRGELAGDFSGIYEDSRGKLWFVGRDVKISSHELLSSRRAVSPTFKTDLKKEHAFTIWEEDSEARIWLGNVEEKFLIVLNEKQEEIAFIDSRSPGFGGLADEDLCAVKNAGNGWVWISTRNSLYKYHLEKQLVEHYPANLSNPTGLRGKIKRDEPFIYDKSGTAWQVLDQNGVIYFNDEKVKFRGIENYPGNSYQLPQDVVSDITKDNEGRLWLSFQDEGIRTIDLENNRLEPFLFEQLVYRTN